MIEVKLIRSGVASKKMFTHNAKCKGVFTKKFNSIEELVLYFRSQCGSIFFAPGFILPPEQQRIFLKKFKAMCKKNYPYPDAKIKKAIDKRTSKF